MPRIPSLPRLSGLPDPLRRIRLADYLDLLVTVGQEDGPAQATRPLVWPTSRSGFCPRGRCMPALGRGSLLRAEEPKGGRRLINPLAIGVTIGGLLLDVLVPRPKPLVGTVPGNPSPLKRHLSEDTLVQDGRGARTSSGRERDPRPRSALEMPSDVGVDPARVGRTRAQDHHLSRHALEQPLEIVRAQAGVPIVGRGDDDPVEGLLLEQPS